MKLKEKKKTSTKVSRTKSKILKNEDRNEKSNIQKIIIE
jgi:hypothetical protein